LKLHSLQGRFVVKFSPLMYLTKLALRLVAFKPSPNNTSYVMAQYFRLGALFSVSGRNSKDIILLRVNARIFAERFTT